MSEDIFPDDVIDTAAQVCRDCGFASRNFNYRPSAICMAIAKAIHAERERCENLARRYSEGYAKAIGMYGAADKDSGRGRQEGHINAGREIADLIRISASLPAAPKGEA